MPPNIVRVSFGYPPSGGCHDRPRDGRGDGSTFHHSMCLRVVPGSGDDWSEQGRGGVVDEDVEDDPRVGNHQTARGIDPGRALPEGRIARVRPEQGAAPIEGKPEGSLDGDLALGVLLRAREP